MRPAQVSAKNSDTLSPVMHMPFGNMSFGKTVRDVLVCGFQQMMRPLGTDLRVPLDEGMVMDMPITVPRISVTQSGDDLKARDMLLSKERDHDQRSTPTRRASEEMFPSIPRWHVGLVCSQRSPTDRHQSHEQHRAKQTVVTDRSHAHDERHADDPRHQRRMIEEIVQDRPNAGRDR